MADADALVYNIAVFIAALFLLESGADKFVDHTAAVARRTGVSETLIGLVTAGGEWEELAVVVASLARHRASLAMGNVIGSAISNILGAFSLGLLAHDRGCPIEFDRSSRLYAAALLALTTFVAPVAYFPDKAVWTACGGVLIAAFVVYLGSVGWAISRGTLTAPEDSDSDSDSDSEAASGSSSSSGGGGGSGSNHDAETGTPSAATPLLGPPRSRQPHRHSIAHHLSRLVLGFLAICLAGYLLAHASAAIADALGLADALFGVVVLAVATTLPEKLVAVLSGARGRPGILIANTAGSNVFLLSLCVGVVLLSGGAADDGGGNVNAVELGVLWACTVAFAATVWWGGGGWWGWWVGAGMLVCYVVFVVLEFVVVHGGGGGGGGTWTEALVSL